MILATTINKLHEMRLSAMAESFRTQLQDATFEALSFEDRFSLIVDTEWARRKNNHLTKLIRVKDMHERKRTMADLADGFIAIPGGVGTFEELFEVLSWAQLGIHKKPIGVLNISNYFDSFINLVENIVAEGFMNPSNTQLLLVSQEPNELIKVMSDYAPPILGNKWHDLETVSA